MRLKQRKIKVIPDNFRNSNKRTIREQLFRKGTDFTSFVIHQEDKKTTTTKKKTGESALKLDNFPLCIVKLLNTKGNKPYSFKLFADIGRF